MKNFLLVFTLCIAASTVSIAQSKMYLKINDIEGTATDKEHNKWIDVLSIDFGVERSVDMADLGSTQRRHSSSNFRHFTIQKQMDVSSPKLALSVANGTVYKEILIHLTKATRGGEQVYCIYKLGGAIVDSYSVAGSAGDVMEESITIAYTTIEITYKKQDPKTGQLTDDTKFNWNLKTGQGG